MSEVDTTAVFKTTVPDADEYYLVAVVVIESSLAPHVFGTTLVATVHKYLSQCRQYCTEEWTHIVALFFLQELDTTVMSTTTVPDADECFHRCSAEPRCIRFTATQALAT